jgi:hypothetical protein
MSLENVQRKGGVASASFGLIAISVWDETPTFDQARSASAVIGQLAAQHSGIALLSIVGPGCSIPDGPIRDHITEEVRRHNDHIRSVAHVIESVGFGAAAVRAVLTGMSVILHPPYTVKAFSTVAEAGAHLKSFFPKNARPTGFVDALVELRKRA